MSQLTINPQPCNWAASPSCSISTVRNENYEGMQVSWSMDVATQSIWFGITNVTPRVPWKVPDNNTNHSYGLLAACLLDSRMFETLRAISQSGEQTEGSVGFAGDGKLTTPPSLAHGLKTVKLSKLVGPSRYFPSLEDLREVVSSLLEARAAHLEQYRVAFGLTDAAWQAAHEFITNVVVSSFVDLSSVAAANMWFALRITLLKFLISDAQFDRETDTLTLNLTTKGQQWVSSMDHSSEHWKTVLSDAATSFMDDCLEQDKFESRTIGEDSIRFQLPQDETISRFFEEASVAGSVNIETNAGTTSFRSTLTGDNYNKRFDSVDENHVKTGQLDSSSRSDVSRLIEPPSKRTSAPGSGDCPKYEYLSNPLAIAVAFGVVSQSTHDKMTENVTDYAKLTPKQRKKKYDTEEVKPNVEGKTNQTNSRVTVPELSAKTLTSLIAKARAIQEQSLCSLLKAAVARDGLELPVWTDPKTKQQYIVMVDRPALSSALLTALADDEGLNVSFSANDGWLMGQIDSLDSREQHVFIPLQRYRNGGDIPTKEGVFSSFGAPRLASPEYVDIAGLASLVEIERQHCIDAYKARAEAGLSEDTETFRAGSKYWWLILLIIPVVAVLYFIVRSKRKTKAGSDRLPTSGSQNNGEITL